MNPYSCILIVALAMLAGGAKADGLRDLCSSYGGLAESYMGWPQDGMPIELAYKHVVEISEKVSDGSTLRNNLSLLEIAYKRPIEISQANKLKAINEFGEFASSQCVETGYFGVF